MDDGVAGIAGHEQHFQAGSLRARRLGELPAVHAGQDDVRQQEIARNCFRSSMFTASSPFDASITR